MNNINKLKESYGDICKIIPGARKETSKQYNAPCFICGGNDRLVIFADKQSFWCRKCDIKGDVIDYFKHTGESIDSQFKKQGIDNGKISFNVNKDDTIKNKLKYSWDKSSVSSEEMKEYFNNRGITSIKSDSIRFNKWKKQGEYVKRILCKLSKPGDTEPVALHSIFIENNGKTYIKKKKITKGEQKGRAVWLNSIVNSDKIIIGEGLENVLSVRQEIGDEYCYAAALTTSCLVSVELPKHAKTVYIACDQDTDEKGCSGQVSAIKLAKRLEKDGIETWIFSPSEECFSGDVKNKLDFNDIVGRNEIIERFSKKQKICDIDFDIDKRKNTKKNIKKEYDKYPAETLEELNKINDEYAACLVSGKFRIAKEVYNHMMGFHTVEFLEKGSFDNFLAHKKVFVFTGGGELKKSQLAKEWMQWDARRTFDSVIFDPEQKVSKAYNLFKGFSINPVKGDWSLLQNHIKNILCDNNDIYYHYLMSWMARIIQAPGSPRPGVAIVLQGGKGVGKGTLANCFGKLLGESFIPVSSAKKLTGDFNMHLSKALFVFADEAVWGGDKSAEGRLKHLITDPTCDFEPKGIDTIVLPCHANVMIASNELWVVPASTDERRFFVLHIKPVSFSRNYFDKIYDQMENGGYEAMMHDLQEYDYKKISLRDAPVTDGLVEQVKQGLDNVQSFWLSVLERGYLLSDKDTLAPKKTNFDDIDIDTENIFFPRNVFKHEVYNEFSNIHLRKSKFPVSSVTFWKCTKKLFDISESQITHNGGRVRAVKLPGYVEMTIIFENKTGIQISVPENLKNDDGIPF